MSAVEENATDSLEVLDPPPNRLEGSHLGTESIEPLDSVEASVPGRDGELRLAIASSGRILDDVDLPLPRSMARNDSPTRRTAPHAALERSADTFPFQLGS